MGFMKKLTSVIVASSLVLGLVGTGFAAFDTTGVNAAANRMKDLGLVQGKVAGSADLQLGSNITRAELVTIIARAYGQEANAAFLKGAVSFPDVAASHWATGYIAISKNIIEAQGHTMGMPNGTFQPDANVTSAEAVSFMLKFLGVPFNMSTTSWPDGYIQVAVDRGLINADDKAMLTTAANQAATRGLVFYLADNSFYNYKLANGKTVYTTYVDATAPTLSIDSVGASTTAAKATISGSVSADATAVYVGSMANSVTVTAGKFSTEVNLVMGTNAIAVMAVDLAGNVSEKSVSITRTVGAAVEIKAPASITVVAGAQAEAKAEVVDKDGNVLAGETVTGESTLGTYAAGVFTAGTTAGAGTLTLTHGPHTYSVNVTVEAGALAKVTASATSVAPGAIVNLTGTDTHGNVLTGVSFSVDSADALVGSNGNFISSKAGNYVVTATKDGASATITIGVYGAATKTTVNAAATMLGNNATKYDVTVNTVDANGNTVANSAGVSIQLVATGATIYLNDGTTLGDTAAAVKTGTYTFKVVVPNTSAGQVIEFQGVVALPAPGLTTGKTTTEVTAQVATAVKVSFTNSAKFLVANAVNVQQATVKVVDQLDQAMLSGNHSAKVVLTGPATFADLTKEQTVAVTAGTANFNIQSVQGLTGAVTVTATIDGLGSAAGNLTSVVTGTAANIVVTPKDSVTSAKALGTLEYTVTFTDSNGYPASQGVPANVSLDFGTNDMAKFDVLQGGVSLAAGSTKTLAIVANTGTFQVKTVAAFTGNLPATVKSTGLTSATPSINFTADAEWGVQLNRTQVAVSVADPKATITAQLYDQRGNKVAKAGIELTVDSTDTTVTVNGTAEKATAKTDANGVATFEVVTRPFAATYNLSVTGKVNNDGAALDTAVNGSIAVNVKNVVAASVVVTLHTDDVNKNLLVSTTAGQNVIVRAVVKDNYGAALAGEATNLKLDIEKVLWVAGALADGTTIVFAPTGTVGTYEATVMVAKAGLQSFKVVNEAGQTVLNGTRALNIAAHGTVAAFKVDGWTGNATTVTKSTVTGPYTVQLTDAYGNGISTGTSQSITVATAGGVSIRSAQAGADLASFSTFGSYSFYLAAGATPTPVGPPAVPATITLTLGGASTTFNITIE